MVGDSAKNSDISGHMPISNDKFGGNEIETFEKTGVQDITRYRCANSEKLSQVLIWK
jgi:hypothetical protein